MEICVIGSERVDIVCGAVRKRLDNITGQRFTILTLNQPGFCQALFRTLQHSQYRHVRVYEDGDAPCDAVAANRWESRLTGIPKRKKRDGRWFRKYELLAIDANYGFLIWDKPDPVLVRTCFNFVQTGKKVLFFDSTRLEMRTLATLDDLGRVAYAGPDGTKRTFDALMGHVQKLEDIARRAGYDCG